MAELLPPAPRARYTELAVKAREAEKRGDIAAAERWMLEAWGAIPEPKLDWAEGQIMTGDFVCFYRATKQFGKAREWSRTMAIAYCDPMDPYVRLLLGTVAFEEGSLDEAFEILDGLHREDGARPFAAEDPRYLEFVRSRRRGAAGLGTASGRQAVSWAGEAAGPPPERAELPPKVHREIVKLGKKGDALARKGQYVKAIEVYREGIDLLPRPKAHWDAATWLLLAIADAQFLAGEFAAAVDTLEDAQFCPGAVGNPVVHLRLGECLLETGQRDRALDELARAYMGAGRKIFENDDPKYLAALATVLKPPAGQDSL